jgi:hypothetical protein
MLSAAANDTLTFQPVWTAAGVVSGFVVSAYMFRIKREAEMRSERKWYWLTAADHVLILSLGVGLVGVFVLPVLGAGLSVAKYALGWSMLLLAGYPLAAAGHYEILFGHPPAQRKQLRGQRSKGPQLDAEHAAAQKQFAAREEAAASAREPERVSSQEKWCVAFIAAASVAYWVAVIFREAN